MASKARQSVFGGFLGLSLKLVILPFFMRLCSSGRYDANDRTSYGVGDKEHSAIDKADGVDAKLVSGVAIIEFDQVRIQEHLDGRPEVDAVLCPVGLFLGVVPFEIHGSAVP
jgi:hypothetical protein